MAIRVGVFGVGGRMGSMVAKTVDEAPGLELVAGIDPAYAGVGISEVVDVSADFLMASSAEAIVGAEIDVMVDFTHIEAAMANLEVCAANGIHSVIGTSGFTEADHEAIAAMFTRSNCMIAPNFAIGAVLMMRFAEMAAPYFDTGEIIELHHDGKVDAPSGTAIATAERMAAASDQWVDDPTESETLANARGAVGPAGIPIHSVRMRGMTAHQEVVLGTVGQTLSIRHDSIDRTSFMPGVVLAVRHIAELDGLTIGLDKILT